MGPRVIIRKGRPSDAARAVDIVFPILRSSGIEPDPTGFDADIAQFGQQDDDSVRSFVAEVDGKVMGVLTLQVQDAMGPKITGVYVSLDSRRQGLGARRISQATHVVKEMGGTRIHLETREIFVHAVKLYESTGWIRGPDRSVDSGPERTYHLDLGK